MRPEQRLDTGATQFALCNGDLTVIRAHNLQHDGQAQRQQHGQPPLLTELVPHLRADELLADEQLSVDVRMRKAFEDEHNLPNRRDLVGRI